MPSILSMSDRGHWESRPYYLSNSTRHAGLLPYYLISFSICPYL